MGAFIGGLVSSSSPYAHQLFSEVLPLRGVLIGLFFTAVGMLLDPLAALMDWQAVLGYVVGVIGLKSLVVVTVVALVLRWACSAADELLPAATRIRPQTTIRRTTPSKTHASTSNHEP